MPDAVDLLNAEVIRAMLNGAMDLEVWREIDSTNRYLGERARQGLIGPWGCLAEYQTAGRGRRGKNWLSPLGSGLCLSLLWTARNTAQEWHGLSLALGTAIIKVLEQRGAHQIGLKWPNDLYCARRKLGGLLIELSTQPDGIINLIIGLGINILVPLQELETLDQPWTDLTHAGWNPCPRNELAAQLLITLAETMRNFEITGLAPFLELWRAYDILKGQTLTIQLPNGEIINGIGAGIDHHGTLQIYQGEKLLWFSTGEISLRFAD